VDFHSHNIRGIWGLNSIRNSHLLVFQLLSHLLTSEDEKSGGGRGRSLLIFRQCTVHAERNNKHRALHKHTKQRLEFFADWRYFQKKTELLSFMYFYSWSCYVRKLIYVSRNTLNWNYECGRRVRALFRVNRIRKGDVAENILLVLVMGLVFHIIYGSYPYDIIQLLTIVEKCFPIRSTANNFTCVQSHKLNFYLPLKFAPIHKLQ